MLRDAAAAVSHVPSLALAGHLPRRLHQRAAVRAAGRQRVALGRARCDASTWGRGWGRGMIAMHLSDGELSDAGFSTIGALKVTWAWRRIERQSATDPLTGC